MKTEPSLVREIRKGIIAWYDFKRGSHVLYVGTKEDAILEWLNSRQDEIDVAVASAREAQSESFITSYRGKFDYIVCVELLEREADPAIILKQWRELLAPYGICILGMNNRMGIRYFCGDKDKYTGRNFDGVEHYRHVLGSEGRMYSRAEIKDMLDRAGFTSMKLYSVFPDLSCASHIFAYGYVPNEDVTNRIFPAYNSPDTVFLEEEALYPDLIDNGMFHDMANAYFVEATAGKEATLSDALQITASMGRSAEDAMVTIIYGSGMVEKRNLYPQGHGRFNDMIKYGEDLEKHGVDIVPMTLTERGIRMLYIDAPSGQLYLRRLLQADKEAFLKALDMFYGRILASSDIILDDKGDGEGAILEYGYPDLVPLNSFFTDGKFVFFDQEFRKERYPANVMAVRMISMIYFGNPEFNRIIPEEALYERYNLLKRLDKWRDYDWRFISELRNEEELETYHRQIRRSNWITDGNRRKIDYSCAGWRAHEAESLIDINGRRLILFGAGKYAERFIDSYGMDYKIDFIVDNDRKRQGERLHGIKIYGAERIEDVSEDEYKVIVCVKDYMSIFRQLDGYGLRNYGLYDGKFRQHKIFRDKESESLPKRYHIGYCAGAFDMFHIGHLNLLRRAKERCDYLIVGVMSDERMYELKKKYPVIPCNERMQVVEGCRYVDRVEELPISKAGIMDAYERFRFDCMFSGDDHAEDVGWLAERERLRKHGSDIVFVSYTKETSSSEIRKKMKDDAEKVLPGDSRLLTDKNHRWIYTYDYAPDSVWEEWRSAVYALASDKESGDSPVPSWIAQEADAVAGRLHCAGDDTGREDLPAYVLLSDSHFAYNGTWDDTVASMKAISVRIRLDGIIHLGDLTDGLLPLAKTKEIEDRLMSDMRSLGVPVHVMPGNHDYNYFRNNPDIRYPENSRYFIDDEKHKLRLIFIDSFDPKEEVRYGFSGECASWLDGALSSMSEGYRSIVFSHVPPLVRLQAWTKDIRNRAKLIEVLDRHADRIMALISGHSHCDLLFNELHNGKFPIVLINCAKCEYFLEHKPKDAVVPFRRLGDRTQESFDIMQVDTVKNEIYFTRFGAGRDRVVRNHKAEWM